MNVLIHTCASVVPRNRRSENNSNLRQAGIRKLQDRIVKAHNMGKYGKVKALQWLLTHSFYAKMEAVNFLRLPHKGIFSGPKEKSLDNFDQHLSLARGLKRRAYQPTKIRRLPLKRNLSIKQVSNKDQAMMNLYYFSIAPILKTNAYALFLKQNQRRFDAQGHAQICSDKSMLALNFKFYRKLLESKSFAARVFADRTALMLYKKNGRQPFWTDLHRQPFLINHRFESAISSLLNFSFFAEAFSGAGKRFGCTKSLQPILAKVGQQTFLLGAKRELGRWVTSAIDSDDKGRVKHNFINSLDIVDGNRGISLRGLHITQTAGGKLVVKPSKQARNAFSRKISEILGNNRSSCALKVIRLINMQICVYTSVFSACPRKQLKALDRLLVSKLWPWAKRRHPKKGTRWIYQRYFFFTGQKKWLFGAKDAHSNLQLMLKKFI
ncbi:reverse transcriptase N-terminal domain-containing protein [Pedobacter sp. AW1-32]|uniref:reverse transcriptase N-terminal domain-containing protein n=1 Tax=Pedobacter sp. AW1-32 TaxID=3383026 RepID=UPI003FF012CD